MAVPTVPFNFLCLPKRLSNYATARYVVMPIPYDAAVSGRSGARHGPNAIIAASEHMEFYDDELDGQYHDAGIATLEPIEPDVSGPEAMIRRIEAAADGVVADGKTLIGLGGDHCVTLGLFRAVRKRHPGASVLQIDAHADLRDEYHSSPFSHACVMRRIAETGARIVGVAVRSISAEEMAFIRSKPEQITEISGWRCVRGGDWLEIALAGLSDEVYVTIDIDGFDPSVAPGTGTPEPGGLDWFQACSLLRAVAEARNIVGADVVEVSPVAGMTVTEHLAARLAYKIIAYREHARQAAGERMDPHGRGSSRGGGRRPPSQKPRRRKQ